MGNKSRNPSKPSEFRQTTASDSDSAWRNLPRSEQVRLVEDLEKFSGILGCYLIFGQDGIIRYMNLQGLDLLDADALRRHGWKLSAVLPESQRDVFACFLARVFDSGARESCEVMLQTAGGRTNWVRVEARAAADGNACHAVLFDVTGRREEEARLAASERKYRTLFANMSTAFSYHRVVRGGQGKVAEPVLLEANGAYGIMLGVPLNEIIGKNNTEISAGGCAPQLDWERLCNDVAVQRQPACFEYYDAKLNRWLSVIAYSPAPEHMALVYVDITKTKVAEQVVSESERRYRNLIQGTDVVIMIVNAETQITFVNEYGLAFFGFSEQELLNRSLFDTIAPALERSEGSRPEAFARFKGKPGARRQNIQENMTRSGRHVWLDWTNHELQDPKTGERIVICVGVDVSDSKRNEQEALRRMRQQRQRELFNDAIQRRLGYSECAASAQLLGIELEMPLILALIEFPANYLQPEMTEKDREERQYAIDSLIGTLQYVGVGLAWQTAEGIAVLRSIRDRGACVSQENLRAAAADIARNVTRYWNELPLRMGVSRLSGQTGNIGEMYDQALAAGLYGPLLHPDREVHYWHDLGCYQFVLRDIGSEQSRRFVHDTLGKLLDGSANDDGGELLATLRELLTGDSAQVIARRLGVHPQTVAFRKKKIERCLDVDLDSMEARLRLTIATRLLSFIEKKTRMVHLVV